MLHIRDQHCGVEIGLKVQFKTSTATMGSSYRHTINITKQIHTYGNNVRQLRLINQTLDLVKKKFL